ncbi:MAG: hypothetical protein ACLFVJ_17275 [Persicimonas sp.]
MNDDKTTSAPHDAVNGALEALFVGQTHEEAFGEISAQAVQKHLADCAACRRLYDGLALADRQLADRQLADGDHEPVSSDFEAAFGEAAFSAALDDLLAEEAAENATRDSSVVDFSERSAQSGQSDRPAPPMRLYAAAAAVLLIGVSGWMILGSDIFGTHTTGEDEFQARSATNANANGPVEQPELELFCAQRTSEGVNFTGKEDAPLGLISCPLDAELKLAYRNTATQLRYAAFFGVDQTGKIYWYGPTPSDGAPLEIEPSATVEPVGESIRLAVNHRPGRIRVVGVFASDPIRFSELRRGLDKTDVDRLYRGERLDDPSTRDLSRLGTITTASFEVIEGGSQ